MTEAHPSESPALTAPSAGNRAVFLRQPAFWLAAVALGLIMLLAWLGVGRLNATRDELGRRLATGEAAQREMQAQIRQNREALDALQAKVGALDARLAEIQSQQLALEAIYQELSRASDDRLLAQIEQDLAIATQQLQLAGNVEAALIALQGAEARLAKSAQPQFLPLRKLINRDIERLKAMPGADVPGIALKLDAILDKVADLPLAFEQRPLPARPKKKPQVVDGKPAAAAADAAPEAASPWLALGRAWLADLWGEVRKLVHIERIDRADPGLLSPRESFFLRENLRLRLLSARLALLARDGRTFQSDLRQAAEWLERYFDTRLPAVQEAQATLEALGKLEVMRTPPELAETLSVLRNFKLSRDRGPGR